ncbi:UPF0758 protein yeeS [Escherichia coli HVH 44 (4-2298570)]|nr:UPF0758 protein yeeS [Escherichia coli HVH 44 (4-2298570)]
MQQLSFLPGEMTPGERSLIQRALKTLDRHLHEPGVAFTSTRAAREWGGFCTWRDWNVKSSGCCI